MRLSPRQAVFKAWHHFNDQFNGGLLFPYALISQPIGNTQDRDEPSIVVDATNALIASIIERTHIPASCFSGPTWVNGAPQSVDAAKALLDPDNKDDMATLSQFRNVMIPHVATQNGEIVGFYTQIDTPFDPEGACRCCACGRCGG
jgi:hypothetical protein